MSSMALVLWSGFGGGRARFGCGTGLRLLKNCPKRLREIFPVKQKLGQDHLALLRESIEALSACPAHALRWRAGPGFRGGAGVGRACLHPSISHFLPMICV